MRFGDAAVAPPAVAVWAETTTGAVGDPNDSYPDPELARFNRASAGEAMVMPESVRELMALSPQAAKIS